MRGLVVDNFAGGGGASLGIVEALREIDPQARVDLAINHDPIALGVHEVNHPETHHLVVDVFDADARVVTGGQPVALAWFSPDCRHHSKAKGGRPVSKSVRALAWVVIKWAVAVHPSVIVLENVEEFQHWGPLVDDKPCKERRGQTFNLFIHRLRQAGYVVDWRELRACDYGAPTVRKRLFIIARCDGKPIAWPAPTHGKPGTLEVASGQLKPYRSAAEIIDWSLPCPSIFLSREEGRALGVNRPLADKTMARIARGVVRYVLNSPKPFIVRFTQNGIGQAPDEPLDTVMAGAPKFGVVEPFIVPLTHGGGEGRSQPLEDPLMTVTGAHRGEQAMVATTLIQTGYGEREGQAPRTLDLGKPLGTAVGGGQKHALVAAFLAQHNTDMVGHHPAEPVSTIVGKGCTQGVVAAHMISLKGDERRDAPCDVPLGAVCAQGTHAGLIAAFLTKFHGEGGQWQTVDDPLHTVDTKDRHGLVAVEIDGATYVIVDIGMRMLTPRELARAQGFPDDYVFERLPDGKPVTKTHQVRLIGNSVCPDVARAIVAANCGEEAIDALPAEGLLERDGGGVAA